MQFKYATWDIKVIKNNVCEIEEQYKDRSIYWKITE